MLTQVQDALAQVRELQQAILQRLRFKGFSGPTRAISGSLALATAVVMMTPLFPQRIDAHLISWGAVFAVALALNLGALIYWFLHDRTAARDVRKLSPVLDVLFPLLVGGILTVALVLHGQHRYLFGTWMCMFGLTNLASRYVLPWPICIVGVFYIICGAVFLLAPKVSFLNPWPMGIVFFAGEWAGGLILHLDDRRFQQARNLASSEA